MDNELFELCKEAYRRTQWAGIPAEQWFGFKAGTLETPVILGHTPSYTSDYLLEKLPKELENHFLVLEICNAHNELEWTADYYNHRYFTYLVSYEPSKADVTHGNTPLKAILNLVIALDEAGQLKGDK